MEMGGCGLRKVHIVYMSIFLEMVVLGGYLWAVFQSDFSEVGNWVERKIITDQRHGRFHFSLFLLLHYRVSIEVVIPYVVARGER